MLTAGKLQRKREARATRRRVCRAHKQRRLQAYGPVVGERIYRLERNFAIRRAERRAQRARLRRLAERARAAA